jgi:hypothetical protein
MPAIERSGLLTTDLVAKPARATMATLSPVICRLYGLFLDRDREYSCAYFPKGTETPDPGTGDTSPSAPGFHRRADLRSWNRRARWRTHSPANPPRDGT